MALLTVNFLWMAKKVSEATGRVTGWFVEGGVGDVEGGQGSDGKEGLPRAKSKMVVGDEKESGSAERKGVWGVGMVSKEWLARNLKTRLAVIVVTLWLLNWLY